ncbi:hypothetical protein [Streptomyces luteogriseus]
MSVGLAIVLGMSGPIIVFGSVYSVKAFRAHRVLMRRLKAHEAYWSHRYL